jgi:hypothetical protein
VKELLAPSVQPKEPSMKPRESITRLWTSQLLQLYTHVSVVLKINHCKVFFLQWQELTKIEIMPGTVKLLEENIQGKFHVIYLGNSTRDMTLKHR